MFPVVTPIEDRRSGPRPPT